MWNNLKTTSSNKAEYTLNTDRVSNYIHFLEVPLKCAGCWGWYKNPRVAFQTFVNYIYLGFVLFTMTNLLVSLFVHLYYEWIDIMASLNLLADGLPLLISIWIVAYFAMYKSELYELVEFMNSNFKWHSARGLTNMTMSEAYRFAKNFCYFYINGPLFHVITYTFLPVIVHLCTKEPLEHWIYADVTQGLILVLLFLRQCLTQGLVGLAFGSLGVFFACNTILLCGQLDMLCCCLRNVRYTALLQHGVLHGSLASQFSDITLDEEHSYLYNRAEMSDSRFHYDNKWKIQENKMQFDIYSSVYDDATVAALQDCARLSQGIKDYYDRFEKFTSPLLVLRVIQVTMYLCTLLYAASLKLDMVTVEYLVGVSFDMFIYCYFGNQITLQADRVTTAAYQSAWHTMGVRPRRMLLNILLSNRKPMLVKAGSFLTINLVTYVQIMKTSFSYYTLLADMSE